MKTFLAITVIGFVAASLCAADDTKSDVKAAAKKLADKPNYSWTSTPKFEGGQGGGGFRPGPTEGKIEKGGWVQTSAKFNDATIETVIKGEKGAVKREDEWKTVEELEADDQGPGAFMARRIKTFKAPAAQAEDIADKVKELKKGDDGLYSGDLTDEGAKALSSFGGRRPGGTGGPQNAKGTAKFWVKDGVLAKYEYNLQSTMKRPDSDEEIKVNRTTTVEIKEVGSTKVSIPAEVKKKLQ
jgi:hypothetical protein